MGSSEWLPMLVLCGLACGSGEEPSELGGIGASSESSEVGALSPDRRADSPRIRQLRVDLAGTDSAPRIERARLVEVFEAAPPVPSLGGAAMLVGYASSGAVSTAMPFSLPKTVKIEASRDGAEPGAELPLEH